MTFLALHAANELLREHPDVDPMKLQKLLYYANGWWLATHGKPLINETPGIWRYSPCSVGSMELLPGLGVKTSAVLLRVDPLTSVLNSLEVRQKQMKRVSSLHGWEHHGPKSAIALSDKTHALGTPWRDSAEKHQFRVPEGTSIPIADNWAYFSALAEVLGAATTPLAA